MKFRSIVILSAVLVVTLNSSCKREPFYSCICHYKPVDTSQMSDSMEIHRLGRMTSREAYLACQAYDAGPDSNAHCIMEIRK
jgi:hypothetical protein